MDKWNRLLWLGSQIGSAVHYRCIPGFGMKRGQSGSEETDVEIPYLSRYPTTDIRCE